MEQAIVEHGLHLAEGAPSFVQRRLKKKAMRVGIFGFQRSKDGAWVGRCWGRGLG